MENLKITNLISGGIITNYNCSSRCAHCLYACSPKRKKDYISDETAFLNAQAIKRMGCDSVHIGGGEPFLNINKLESTIKIILKAGVNIEYIETNSSWFKDLDQATEVLKKLKKAGLQTILVSIDPFHNEFIPFYKVKGVLKAAKKAGIETFPWIMGFYNDIDSLDDSKTHTIEEYKNLFDKNYLRMIPTRIWIHYIGRSIETFRHKFVMKKTNEIIEKSTKCLHLLDTDHFHIDLYGNYIPGLCSGLSIQREDLGREIYSEKYPYISALFKGGVKELFELATEKYGFEPKMHYLYSCHLCQEIRKFLVTKKYIESPDLQPVEFYFNL